MERRDARLRQQARRPSAGLPMASSRPGRRRNQTSEPTHSCYGLVTGRKGLGGPPAREGRRAAHSLDGTGGSPAAKRRRHRSPVWVQLTKPSGRTTNGTGDCSKEFDREPPAAARQGCAITNTTVMAASATPPMVNSATVRNRSGTWPPVRSARSSSRWRCAPTSNNPTARAA